MSIVITVQNVEVSEQLLAVAEKAALEALRRFGDAGAEVSLLITDEELIRELNRTWRGVDAPTDVLSFSLLEGEDGPPVEEPEQGAEPESGQGAEQLPVLLGDVVISLPRVYRQAAEYGHTVEREMAFLTVHGVLHLLGFGHDSAEERSIMRESEEAVLSGIGYSRQGD
ncbi:MAG TPA: rRNA maturation RNase YbeY [Firmicutes bacterium]|nr:rRNA maturation RNase YbeY [Bacillota bacterium]